MSMHSNDTNSYALGARHVLGDIGRCLQHSSTKLVTPPSLVILTSTGRRTSCKPNKFCNLRERITALGEKMSRVPTTGNAGRKPFALQIGDQNRSHSERLWKKRLLFSVFTATTLEQAFFHLAAAPASSQPACFYPGP